MQELIATIDEMRKTEKDTLLFDNGQEARDWLKFLREHTDKEELKSLEDEISDRLVYRFDVQIGKSTLDNKRVYLMRSYISKSAFYLK